MPDDPVAEGAQGKVTFVLAKRGYQTLRFRVRMDGLSIPEAINRLLSRIDRPFFGAFMVRERGKGRPENKYQKVPADSNLVLTERHILKAWG